MLKRNYLGLLLVSAFLLFQNTFAQLNILNAKTPAEIGVKTKAQVEADNDKPLPYAYVDDRDIMWSITTWEIIDLDERANFPLYFPIDTTGVSSDRRSLFDVLMKAVKAGKLTEIYYDSYFTEKKDYENLKESFQMIDTMEVGIQALNNGDPFLPEYIMKRDLTADAIKQYHIKGIWYFDKRQGELKYRLLAIAPAAPSVAELDKEGAKIRPLFWVWYPAAREILHNAKVFNINNSAKPISFDHLLNSRRFTAVIYKEDNVYNDREIVDYLPSNSMYQLLESDRIREKVRNREHDLWAY